MENRFVWIDNLKGFLAVLVIIGHTVVWSGLTGRAAFFLQVYFLINSFHMAAFFCTSGWLFGACMKKDSFGRKKILRRIMNILVPTAVFTLILLMTLIVLAGYSFFSALRGANYWFMYVLAFLAAFYPVFHQALPNTAIRLCAILFLFLFGRILGNKVSMFAGYSLSYAIGVALGENRQWLTISGMHC